MSLETRMDRRIFIERTVPMLAKDAYGNEEVDAEQLGPFSASRSLKSADEDRAGRDSQEKLFRYLIDRRAASVSGYDRIIDGDETLEIVGAPEDVPGAATVHHVEVDARIVRG